MKIIVGSRAFFESFNDFTPHDNDYVLFENNPSLYKEFAHIRGREEDTFAYRHMSKDEFLNYELEHCKKLPMAIGKLLVPELCKYLGITIDDLKKFQFAIDAIDNKHEYEKIIYYSYLENNDFYLTSEQLNNAYNNYKSKKEGN